LPLSGARLVVVACEVRRAITGGTFTFANDSQKISRQLRASARDWRAKLRRLRSRRTPGNLPRAGQPLR